MAPNVHQAEVEIGLLMITAARESGVRAESAPTITLEPDVEAGSADPATPAGHRHAAADFFGMPDDGQAPRRSLGQLSLDHGPPPIEFGAPSVNEVRQF